MATPAKVTPVVLTRFVGRDRETDLARLLPATRLLTLTGAGGSGKTRLANELTGRSGLLFERVVWIDLAETHDEFRVIPAVASAVGVPGRADVPSVDSIVEAIGEHAVLMVMDNCEHVVDVCAGLVETLLRRCPRLTVMATSREALGVPGETAWLVPPLREAEAALLFVERAQSVLPSFAPVGANREAIHAICRRLDGIPLAIELAAARVRVLSPQQIVERLSDAFAVLGTGSRAALPRHRTLRSTIDWSFALLTAHEQQLLLRLSVFAGTFSLEAVEAICTGAPLDDESVLDELSGLVDKSLVVMELDDDDARYRLLETVRQYADELLRATSEHAAFHERHAHHFLTMAELAEPRLFGGADDPALVAALVRESGNVRAAFEWCDADSSRIDWHLRGAYGLHWFWFASGQFDEGLRRLRVAQRHAADSRLPIRLRGQAMVALGHIHVWQGNPQDAITCMTQGHDLLRLTDDPFAIAYALTGVGAANYLAGDQVRASAALDEAASMRHTFESHVLNSLLHYWSGRLHLDAGDLEVAAREFAAAAAVGRRIRNRPAMGHSQLMVGLLALRREDARTAHGAFTEAVGVLASIGDVWGLAQGLEGVGCALLGAHLPDTAAVLLGAASALRERIAAPLLPGDRARIDATHHHLQRTLGRRFEDLWATGVAMTVDAATALATDTTWPEPVDAQQSGDTRDAQPTAAGGPPTGTSAGATIAAGTTAEERTTGGTLTASVVPAAVTVGATTDLRVTMLAPLQILVRGTAVDSRAWGSARSRELLLFLLCHPTGVTKDQVGAALWPDASAAQVRNSFHVTLHRLRRALGYPDWIVVQQGRYRLDAHLSIVCDAMQFEQQTTDAIRLAKRRGPSAADALASALLPYTHDLLAGEAVGDWHVPLHDRLQRLFVDGLQALSTVQLDAGEFADAIATSQRLLAVDSLDEDAWRRIMTAHARRGERAHALRVYQELVDLLLREIDATPDVATARLAERIKRGDAV